MKEYSFIGKVIRMSEYSNHSLEALHEGVGERGLLQLPYFLQV